MTDTLTPGKYLFKKLFLDFDQGNDFPSLMESYHFFFVVVDPNLCGDNSFCDKTKREVFADNIN